MAMRCSLAHSMLHCTAYHTSQDADAVMAFLDGLATPEPGAAGWTPVHGVIPELSCQAPAALQNVCD